jgi:hypothetical protein
VDYLANQQLRDLWHHRLLGEYVGELADEHLKTVWKLRPFSCEESLSLLVQLGTYTLASHDQDDEQSIPVQEHVCSLRIRGFGERGLVVAGGPTPAVAALRCLLGAVTLLGEQARQGFEDLDELLGD